MPCPPCGEVGGAGGGAGGPGGRPQGLNLSRGVWPRGLPARSAKRSAFRHNPSAFPRPLGLILVPRAKMAGRGGVWGPPGGAFVSPGSSGELGEKAVPARSREVPRISPEPRAGSGGVADADCAKMGRQTAPGGASSAPPRPPSSKKSRQPARMGENFSPAGETQISR